MKENPNPHMNVGVCHVVNASIGMKRNMIVPTPKNILDET